MFMTQAVFKDADREPWRDLARHNRMASVAGMLLGLPAFVLIPVFTGLVGL